MEKQIHFLIENGYPMDIHIYTIILKSSAFTSNDGRKTEERVACKSKITDNADNILAEFEHEDLRARIHWVDGFFSGLKYSHGV